MSVVPLPGYEFKETLGKGAYGAVLSAQDLESHQDVGVKECLDVFQSATLAKRMLREVRILASFGDHENILKAQNVIVTKKIGGVMRELRRLEDLPLCRGQADFKHINVHLVTNLMETDLASVIESPQSLCIEHVRFFSYQVARGLKMMHTSGYLHRDLKPRNLLINANCDLRICDFGLARHAGVWTDSSQGGEGSEAPSLMTDYVQTRWYRAPEVLVSMAHYDEKVDMWSLGCVMAEIVLRRPLFRGSGTREQLQIIFELLGKPPTDVIARIPFPAAREFIRQLPGTHFSREERYHQISSRLQRAVKQQRERERGRERQEETETEVDPSCIDVITSLLDLDPSKRPTATEVLSHPFFANLHDESDEPSGVASPAGVESEWAFEHLPSFLDLRVWAIPRLKQSAPVSPALSSCVPCSQSLCSMPSASLSQSVDLTGGKGERSKEEEQEKCELVVEGGAGRGSVMHLRGDGQWAQGTPLGGSGGSDAARQRAAEDLERYWEEVRKHPYGRFLDGILRVASQLRERRRALKEKPNFSEKGGMSQKGQQQQQQGQPRGRREGKPSSSFPPLPGLRSASSSAPPTFRKRRHSHVPAGLSSLRWQFPHHTRTSASKGKQLGADYQKQEGGGGILGQRKQPEYRPAAAAAAAASPVEAQAAPSTGEQTEDHGKQTEIRALPIAAAAAAAAVVEESFPVPPEKAPLGAESLTQQREISADTVASVGGESDSRTAAEDLSGCLQLLTAVAEELRECIPPVSEDPCSLLTSSISAPPCTGIDGGGALGEVEREWNGRKEGETETDSEAEAKPSLLSPTSEAAASRLSSRPSLLQSVSRPSSFPAPPKLPPHPAIPPSDTTRLAGAQWALSSSSSSCLQCRQGISFKRGGEESDIREDTGRPPSGLQRKPSSCVCAASSSASSFCGWTGLQGDGGHLMKGGRRPRVESDERTRVSLCHSLSPPLSID
uniref:Protein kinase domain-containing protein n=1 Tax=Chromera velia CCMP2878 TaxID=1169474 RepID=A0A0G4HCV4_9ALVE|eukprot:Cvel_26162.t1-p1 / transcript=Cvel_26162.t1 / gene=Cvel_26162 / organism=Chromera_velia_CCMP2878 / gene_product=Mitogen-activated protein kinase FUS3, putative / transcript_product=Mitogen-activated protein kinase FUS3, putative / location=Cvel_scaffold3072:8698-12532(-) / protein_length=956 / sequence_SO=supercontig / SO=protein_coding / is_pseudo=false